MTNKTTKEMKTTKDAIRWNKKMSFYAWWHEVGSGMRPHLNEDYEAHAKRVCHAFSEYLISK